MASPTSVADLLELIHQNLPLDPLKLDGYIAQLRKTAAMPGKPGDMAALLVRDRFLTPFQADHLMRGRRPKFLIGKYLILDRIGAGGMGAVYLCEHLQMERQVALKVLPADQADDPAALARFYREAQAVAALNHRNIVRAYDVDMEGKTYFLVMEYVDGINLQELTTKLGRLSPVRAAHYVRQAAEGLQHAHQAHLIHRDIKPANLLLSRAGVLKVLDLGLARFFHDGADSLTKEHSAQAILGTADYLAPEQARDSHAVDIRADIYSLGATFYFLLVGRPPFADGTLNQKLIWHQMKSPTPVRKLHPEIPEAMVLVLQRMMAKDAAGRYQTPAAVAAALAPWTQTALPPPSPSELPPLRVAARAGKPWRKMAPSPSPCCGGVQEAVRPTSLHSPSTVVKSAPTVQSKATCPTLELPSVAAPAATSAVAVAPPPPAVMPTPAADDDWSHMFDDGGDSGGSPSPSSKTRRSGKRLGVKLRTYKWHVVGAGTALLLLGGGLWLMVVFGMSTVKPAPPAVVCPPPPAPETECGPVHLRAMRKGPDAVELTWEDPHGPSCRFRIDRSTDRWFSMKNTVVAAEVEGNVNHYTDTKLKPGPGYYYRVRAEHEGGASGVSSPAWPPPDYSHGFTPAGLLFNRGAVVDGNVLRLTDMSGNTARSAFYHVELDVRSFTTQFRFRISPGDTAEGFTFCIQGGEPTWVGEAGAGLGYQGIPKSAAVKFDLLGNDGESPNSTGLYLNGARPTNQGAIDLTPSGIDLHDGRSYDVKIEYKDKKLTLQIVDAEDPARKFTHTFDVDLPAVVGGATALVGFTGATGQMTANQEILSWTWTPAD